MERREPTQKALVLAGGGARGSYQVGVWRALMELDWHPQIITGTSVGGLNGAMFVLDLYETARDMWLTIRSRDVMELPEENADLSALHQFLRRVVKEGGMDVTPLEEIVERVLDEDAAVLTVTENGYGKRTRIGEYSVQNRGGQGLKTYQITQKTGEIVGAKKVTGEEDILLVSDDGTIIRMEAGGISLLGRATQGVRLMRPAEGAHVVAMARTEREASEEETAEPGESAVEITEE